MSNTKKPNFLLIVADDLGFSDTGPYGSEISTPSLDRLAKEGLRMTDFHTASACSPTRAMLLSGTDNHIAGLGQMAEQMFTSNPDQYKNRPGYEGYLNFRVAALSEILQDAGYLTLMSGKWHLGMKKELSPSARGFKHCITLLPGGNNHFNHEPQLEGNAVKLPFFNSNGFWMEDDKFIDRKTDLPKDFYSSEYFTNRMIEFLEKRTPHEKEQPFFAYLPFTAPHWPLQAPRDIIEKYRGVYDRGPEQLRLDRLRQLQKLGLVPQDIEPAPMVAGTKRWSEMNDTERAESARKMETYAAMVDCMDKHIGVLLDKLEETDELDNTFIVFISDNGAEGVLLEAAPMIGGANIYDIIQHYYDNSVDNIGNATSFTWYGPRWALAATAPSRGFKGWITEGGIRCPCIVRYPKLPLASSGGISHCFTTVMDILPTFLDIAGIPSPECTFHDRPIVPIRGKSWVPYLASQSEYVYDSKLDVTGWELFGLRAIRRGPWKAVLINPPRGTGAWQLFNLEKDPGELHDLSTEETAVMNDLMLEWDKYYASTGMFEVDFSKGAIMGN